MIAKWAQRSATAVKATPAAYLLVVAGVAVSVGAQVLIDRFLDNPPLYMTFFPALIFATLVGGLRGGLVATLASMAAIWWLWLPQQAAGAIWAVEHTRFTVFGFTALATIAMAKAMRSGLLRGVAAEERFRTFQEHAIEAFVFLEPVLDGGEVVDFRWTYANPAAERTAPFGLGGLVGRRVQEVFPDETGAAMLVRLTQALDALIPDDIEVRRVIDGREHWMRSSAVRVDQGVAVSYRDITAQRAAYQALREGEASVRALVTSLPQLLWASRADGECDFLSPQWRAYTGVSRDMPTAEAWRGPIHPDDREAVSQGWTQAVYGGLPFDVEFRIQRHDGAWRWFSSRAAPDITDEGAIRRWFGAATDITEIVEARQHLELRVAERTQELEASLEERARTEAALAQAQKMETVGRLTGGVAHDFNNLLTVVIGGLDLILKHPQDTIRVVRLAEAALAAGRRGERLTRQLLAFSRRQELALEIVDIGALIQQIEPLVRRAVGEAVPLAISLAPDVGPTRLDPAQFEAALLNLVVNAADAVTGGGEIEIATAAVTLADGQAAGAPAGDYVRLSVRDTGVGMSPDVLRRAFEPFFTTKDVGKGTGLGLAQVYGFIHQCGGAVTIDSGLGKGTTISLYLQAAVAPVTVEPPPLPTEAAWAKNARVLLVEDDDGVRAVAEGLLEELGCKVTAEADGPSALNRLAAGETFDLLISDIVMPGGMTGVQLAHAAQARYPDLPVILTTGYAGETLGGGPQDLAWPVLRKPFRAGELGQVVRRALERDSQPVSAG